MTIRLVFNQMKTVQRFPKTNTFRSISLYCWVYCHCRDSNNYYTMNSIIVYNVVFILLCRFSQFFYSLRMSNNDTLTHTHKYQIAIQTIDNWSGFFLSFFTTPVLSLLHIYCVCVCTRTCLRSPTKAKNQLKKYTRIVLH